MRIGLNGGRCNLQSLRDWGISFIGKGYECMGVWVYILDIKDMSEILKWTMRKIEFEKNGVYQSGMGE